MVRVRSDMSHHIAKANTQRPAASVSHSSPSHACGIAASSNESRVATSAPVSAAMVIGTWKRRQWSQAAPAVSRPTAAAISAMARSAS